MPIINQANCIILNTKLVTDLATVNFAKPIN